jgi:DYW family of nucleic acid deaminases
VAECALCIDKYDASTYVLLANTYAAVGRWADRDNVRKMMESRGVKKIPGHSTIEIGGQVHSLVCDDQKHFLRVKIHEKWEQLCTSIESIGYRIDTSWVLKNLEETAKAKLLCKHSEKMAICLGLVLTPPGTPLFITKNLRICGDCHEATKAISAIEGRVIVVRDKRRFHHFENGACSCGGKW